MEAMETTHPSDASDAPLILPAAPIADESLKRPREIEGVEDLAPAPSAKRARFEEAQKPASELSSKFKGNVVSGLEAGGLGEAGVYPWVSKPLFVTAAEAHLRQVAVTAQLQQVPQPVTTEGQDEGAEPHYHLVFPLDKPWQRNGLGLKQDSLFIECRLAPPSNAPGEDGTMIIAEDAVARQSRVRLTVFLSRTLTDKRRHTLKKILLRPATPSDLLGCKIASSREEAEALSAQSLAALASIAKEAPTEDQDPAVAAAAAASAKRAAAATSNSSAAESSAPIVASESTDDTTGAGSGRRTSGRRRTTGNALLSDYVVFSAGNDDIIEGLDIQPITTAGGGRSAMVLNDEGRYVKATKKNAAGAGGKKASAAKKDAYDDDYAGGGGSDNEGYKPASGASMEDPLEFAAGFLSGAVVAVPTSIPSTPAYSTTTIASSSSSATSTGADSKGKKGGAAGKKGTSSAAGSASASSSASSTGGAAALDTSFGSGGDLFETDGTSTAVAAGSSAGIGGAAASLLPDLPPPETIVGGSNSNPPIGAGASSNVKFYLKNEKKETKLPLLVKTVIAAKAKVAGKPDSDDENDSHPGAGGTITGFFYSGSRGVMSAGVDTGLRLKQITIPFSRVLQAAKREETEEMMRVFFPDLMPPAPQEEEREQREEGGASSGSGSSGSGAPEAAAPPAASVEQQQQQAEAAAPSGGAETTTTMVTTTTAS
jgi:hypothetical protein